MSSVEFTVEQQIAPQWLKRPHVVVLGAGASRAAFPNGDKNGRLLPLIKDFVSTLGLEALLQSEGVPPPYDDFEGIYSDVAMAQDRARLKRIIEDRVFDYFVRLELPDTPTLYDHLVLSLRPKDFVATFNWDPFLWQAAERNFRYGNAPQLLFLHGSVAVGYCESCKVVIDRFKTCECGRVAKPLPILYPVKQKNYQSDPAIASHWQSLQEQMKRALTVTFFGYGAPRTDVEAVRLLRNGWGNASTRSMEETEIIDIRPESELLQTWEPFIHSHHYRVCDSFYDSNIASHPRRSCEAIWTRVGKARFVERGEFPRSDDFEALRRWFKPRIDAEVSA